MNLTSFSNRFLSRARVVALAAPALALMSTDASACGGLFCSSAAPVNQTAERILFAHDGEKTTQIVEILYDGPSERFAWVLPVPGMPEIAVSSSIVFQRLQAATNPNYQLQVINPDNCGGVFGNLSFGSAEDASFGGLALDEGGVTVVDQGSVGPFDYQVIGVAAGSADPADVAVRWLEENNYDVGELGPDVLRPYLESGLNLLAVRLQKGLPTGAIRPLSLTFTADRPSIPIRPTAVAAQDDMGILVWVLGESRAVPTNYKGLELNEMMINWFNPGPTYDAVVSAAADEAGGQGFVTELAGAAGPFHDVIDDGSDALVRARVVDVEPGEGVARLAERYGQYDGFEKVFAENVELRDGLTAEDFIGCPRCYLSAGNAGAPFTTPYDATEDPIAQTDVETLLDAVESQVLQPIFDAADLFEQHAYVTRLYTTLSASEMDLDPVFDFNPDLDDLSNNHTAEQLVTCDGSFGPWRVTLEDGRRIYGDGFQWPLTPSATPNLPFNARVVAYKTSGQPDVEVDNAQMIRDEFAELPSSQSNGVGDGCSMAPGRRGRLSSLGLGLLGLGLIVGARRRRR